MDGSETDKCLLFLSYGLLHDWLLPRNRVLLSISDVLLILFFGLLFLCSGEGQLFGHLHERKWIYHFAGLQESIRLSNS